jgi:predicted alpha/beta hydrolase
VTIFDPSRTLFADDDHQATPVVIFNHSQPHARAPVFVCLPAMGVAASFYTPFAEALAQAAAGAAVLADLRGQGESAALARRGARFGYQEIVAQDIPSLIAAIAAQFPGRPIYLVGHSLGGQLGSLAAVHAAPSLAGLILVASGTAHYRVWPKALRWRAGIAVQAVRAVVALLPWYPGRLLGFGGDQPRRLMADWSYNASTGRYRCAQAVESTAPCASTLAGMQRGLEPPVTTECLPCTRLLPGTPTCRGATSRRAPIPRRCRGCGQISGAAVSALVSDLQVPCT